MTSKWADQSVSNPTSPTSPAERTTFTKKNVERPATMVDVRRRTWKKFGEAVSNDAEVTVKEKPVFLELGTIDPLEKACTDEVLTMIHNSQSLRLEVPLSAHLAKLRREAAASGKEGAGAAAAKASAAEAASSPAASPTSAGGGQTWAERNRLKKNERDAAAGGDKGKPQVYERNKVRVSNLVDTISSAELSRIFGPENGLGTIMKIYQPKYKDGAPKQFCYITYRTTAEADAAVKKNNRVAFKNVVLVVDYGTDPNAPAGNRW